MFAAPSPVLAAAFTAPIEIHDLTLQEKAEMVAEQFDISTSTLAALITSESHWDASADNGHDRGLVQISREYHPEISDYEAFDPDFALAWAAERIKNGHIDEWVSCNCYLYTKLFVPVLPRTKDLKPNSPVRVGAVAIYNYNGVPHYAYVTKVQNDPIYGHWEKSTNLKPCTPYTRFVPEDNRFLVGYWYP